MAEQDSKLTRDLLYSLQEARRGEAVSVIVRYVPDRRIMRQRVHVPGAEETYNYRLRPFVHMRATPDAIQGLVADPAVVRIYEDKPVYALLDASVPHLEIPRLWDAGYTGKGVRLAIVDTGIDLNHPDFAGRIVATADFTGQGPSDGNGHGTHCAGIAAGSGHASSGAYRGVAPEASLYTAKVLRNDGQGMMSDVMAGIEWATEQGVQIISLSLGGPGPCDGTDALCEMCDAAVEAGIVVCVAAGNDGPRAYTVGSPGCARQVITIGAADDVDAVASFSSRGPTSDERTKPDVLFPGVEIISARAKGTAMGTVVNDYYTSASGTSMATPHAAGTAALLLQAHPDWTPAQIKARLMETALDLALDANTQGSGRARPWEALTAEVEEPEPEPTPEPSPTPDPTPVPTPGQGCLPTLVNVLFGGRKR